MYPEGSSRRLCSGVVCIALVSRYVLGEPLTPRKLAGFALMFVAMALIASSSGGGQKDEEEQS